jgi:hypothetical protein
MVTCGARLRTLCNSLAPGSTTRRLASGVKNKTCSTCTEYYFYYMFRLDLLYALTVTLTDESIQDHKEI